jgi:hypothetical protein
MEDFRFEEHYRREFHFPTVPKRACARSASRQDLRNFGRPKLLTACRFSGPLGWGWADEKVYCCRFRLTGKIELDRPSQTVLHSQLGALSITLPSQSTEIVEVF